MSTQQIELITALPKEEARQQFERLSKELDLKHTFTFDEVYDLLMERRIERKKLAEFRTGIVKFEEKFKNLSGVMTGDCFPLIHKFADGMYIRQLTVPANTITVTKIHAQTHPFFILKGTVSILTEHGVQKITAPYSGITKAGTKRIIWHHDEVIFTTVHKTEHTDISKIEDEVIAKDFNDLEDKIENTRISEFIRIMSGRN